MATLTIKNKDDPSTYWGTRRNELLLVDTLYDGNSKLKAQGVKYLWKAPKEDLKVYNQRLERAVLTNYYKKAVTECTSAVFDTDIQVTDADEAYQPIVEDVDLEGNNITQFAKKAFNDAVKHGMSFIFIDYPKTPGESTILNQKQGNIRPYWVRIEATQILETVTDYINNIKTLVYLRFEEECDGYILYENEKKQNLKQVRIYEQEFDTDTGQYTNNVKYEIWRKVRSSGAASENSTWILYDSGIMAGFDRIPIVPVYTRKEGFMRSCPPLQDLADINLLHYNAASDNQWNIHMTQVPMLMLKNFKSSVESDGTKQPFIIGPNTIVEVTQEGDAKWITTDGNSIEQGANNLKMLEDQMIAMGKRPMLPRTGNITATSSAIDEAQSDCELKAWARSLEDALSQAFLITKNVGKITAEAPGISVNQEFNTPFRDGNDVENLVTVYEMGVLSSEEFIDELKRRDLIRVDVDAEAAVERMDAEKAAKEERAAAMQEQLNQPNPQDNGGNSPIEDPEEQGET